MRASLDAIPSNMEGSFRRGSVSPSKRAGIEGITPTIDQKKRLPSIFQKYLNLHPVQEDVVTQQKVFEQNQYSTKARAAVLDRYAMTFKNVANIDQVETSSRGSSAPGQESQSRNIGPPPGAKSTIAEEVYENDKSTRSKGAHSNSSIGLELETVKKEPEGQIVCFCRDKRKCNHSDMTGLI